MAKQFLFYLAEQLARVSYYGYTYEPARLAPIDKDLVDEHRIDDGQDDPTSFACVLRYTNRTVVTYRGTTATAADWVQNFRVDRVPFVLDGEPEPLTGEVHRGFLSELNGVHAQVVAVLKQYHDNNKSLYLTGHSQGGAIANLACAALEQAGFPVEANYTFAAPRSGDRDFAKAVEKKTTIHRVEFGNDIVPHVPPMVPPMARKVLRTGGKWLMATASPMVKKILELVDSGYVAVGRLAYAQAGRFALPSLTISQEDELYYDRLWDLIRADRELVEHHDMENYIACVDKY